MVATSPAVSIDHASKRFGARVAVDDLTLDIPAGSVFGLLGPNGAGKTTLLRMITGLSRPSRGSVRLFGDVDPRSRAASRAIGYMPQQLAIYPGLSVEENLLFMGRIYGVPEDRIRDRVREVVRMVDLESRRDSLVATLSGGMARRVMLASTLVHAPRLLILDEPTAGVDPVLRLAFWDWFATLCAEGASILVTTHHISEASRCDTVVFLRTGRLLEQGTPAELMQRHEATDLESAFVKATQEEAPAGVATP